MDHPRLSQDIHTEEDELAATQYSIGSYTWQCGGEYWDVELSDLVTLESIVRKSSWCDTRPPEQGTLLFKFDPEHHRSFEYDPHTAYMADWKPDPPDRFLPRHNVPFELPP